MSFIQVPAEIITVARTLKEAGFQVYVVGGAVRDALLQREVTDWDLCTSAHPEQVQGLFPMVIPTGLKHGTVTVLTPKKKALEVTTLRIEGPYLDGRRPESIRYTTRLEEDLARRDFTINAMAWDPLEQKLYDPFVGKKDLEGKIIKTVGAAVDRFQEDGLRPVRAIRFAAQLDFSLVKEVREAIPKTREITQKVSMERVREEFVKMLLAPKPSVALRLLGETTLLELFIPELLEGAGMTQNQFHAHDVFEHSLQACDHAPRDIHLRLAALFHDIAKPRTRRLLDGAYRFYGHDRLGAKMTRDILRRLRFSNEDVEKVSHLIEHHMFYYRQEWTDAAVRRFLRKVGEENLPDLFDLRIADEHAKGTDAPDYERLENFRRHIEKIKKDEMALHIKELKITGREVMEILGIPPGPRVGEVLHALLEKVIEDPSLNQAETLREEVRGMKG